MDWFGLIGVKWNFQNIRSYRGGQFYWLRKPEYPGETANVWQVADVYMNSMVGCMY